jgi:hypothetical protein
MSRSSGAPQPGTTTAHETGADRALAEFARRVEEDIREPDKLLCHVAWARRILDDRKWTRENL